jgi:acetyl-CoA synthase
MANLPQIPGARKKGVILFSPGDNLENLNTHHISDTVCIDGPSDSAFELAESIHNKYKVGVKVVSQDKPWKDLPEAIEIIPSQISEIVGEGRAEAVKFKDGKAVGVCLVVLMDKTSSDKDQARAFSGSGGAADSFMRFAAKGADGLLEGARRGLDGAIKNQGAGEKISFSGTSYNLPLSRALLNIEAKTLEDCLRVFAGAEALNNNKPAENGMYMDSLGGVLNKGLASLLSSEVAAALAVLERRHPAAGTGFIPDKEIRSLGLQLVDGRISGIAVIAGPAKDEQSAIGLIRGFQSKGIVSMLAGSSAGVTFREQLEKNGIETGPENYIIDLGEDYLSAVYAVNFAARAPFIYGGIKPGQWKEAVGYMRERVPAFLLLLNHIDDSLAAVALGFLSLGFPVISDLDIPYLPKIDTTLFDALVSEKDYRQIPSRCMLARGIKARISEVPVPVPYSCAFEGERINKERLAAEFGGSPGISAELLAVKGEADIEDGKVEVCGADLEQLVCADAGPMPLAVVVDVFGRNMQEDFEPILERQIHRFINYAMGVTHTGRRDTVSIKISRDAFAGGFRLKHIGLILHAMLHQEYGAVVDKVQVKIYTARQDVEALVSAARKIFDARDERLRGMTDENADTFYSCLMCQSFAPNHVCIITPERPGLCGAYSWLDARASSRINPSGPNQPVAKENLIDARLGQWESVNRFVGQKSNNAISAVSLYSLMNNPQSSCGLFECIAAVIPEANGVMVVQRDYSGTTPLGMSFTDLAVSIGGAQVPGFLGVSRSYILSRKFICAEGGLKRIVWMPGELKEAIAEGLKKRFEELGCPGMIDKIADETTASNMEELVSFLKNSGHPALSMEPIV